MRTSLGHLHSTRHPDTSSAAHWRTARAATNASSAAPAGSRATRSSREQWRLPGDECQRLPPRPLPSLWRKAHTSRPSGAPEAARRAASSLVLSTLSSVTRSKKDGMAGGASAASLMETGLARRGG